jgi:hypothetical protein
VHTDHSDTLPVLRIPRNKMGKLIFRLSHIILIYAVMSRIVLSTSVPKHVIIEYILHRSTGSEK